LTAGYEPGVRKGGFEIMTTDLQMLVWTALFTAAWTAVILAGRIQAPGGWSWSLGNRDTAFEAPEWTQRADRAHRNMLENLPIFAILVITAHLAGVNNATTDLGAQIYFGARIAHALVYTAGITVVRTLAFFVSVAGMLMILSQLL